MPVHVLAAVRGRFPALAGLLHHGLFLCAAAGLAAGMGGCAGARPQHEEEAPAANAPSRETRAPDAAAPASGRKFEEPGELDKLLDARPMALPAVKPAGQAPAGASAAPKAPEPAKGKGNFRIQIGAESDIDAAQAKKAEYEKLLGGPVDVIFDAPYYKLRWGYFETKQDAEDKILELSDQKIQGFVVKQ
jgi:septal ring-binding cell division protein DamX